MAIPKERFSGPGSSWGPIDFGPVDFGDLNCVCDLNLPDGAFSPTFNNINTIDWPAWPEFIPIVITDESEPFQWPELIWPPWDLPNIHIDPVHFLPDEGEEYPGEGNPRVLAVKSKMLYSSVKGSISRMMHCLRLFLQFADDGAGSHNVLQGLLETYTEAFSYWYYRFFTYGHREILTPFVPPAPFFPMDRGTGGTLDEVYACLSILTTPNPNENWLDPIVMTQSDRADIVDTNIHPLSIWEGTIDLSEICSAGGGCAKPIKPIPERGVRMALENGFAISHIALQCMFFDPKQKYYNDLLKSLLLSGVLKIERLRVNYDKPFNPEANDDCCLKGLDNNPAYENLRECYIWETLFSIPTNRVFLEEHPILNFNNESVPVAGTGADATGELGAWVENPSVTFGEERTHMSGIPHPGFALPVSVFLAPGTIWRAKLVIDPRKATWIMAQFINDIPTPPYDMQFPILIEDCRFSLQLFGKEIIYDWSSQQAGPGPVAPPPGS